MGRAGAGGNYQVEEHCATPGGRQYVRNISKHRGGHPRASQWAIGLDEELAVFATAEARDWHDAAGNLFWGLHLAAGLASALGTEGECIAKFVTGAGEAPWHGYPARPPRSSRDVPCTAVLESWLAAGLITRVAMARVMRRKTCKW